MQKADGFDTPARMYFRWVFESQAPRHAVLWPTVQRVVQEASGLGDRSRHERQLVAPAEVAAAKRPTILAGEAGVGKTTLLSSLAASHAFSALELGAHASHVSGGIVPPLFATPNGQLRLPIFLPLSALVTRAPGMELGHDGFPAESLRGLLERDQSFPLPVGEAVEFLTDRLRLGEVLVLVDCEREPLAGATFAAARDFASTLQTMSPNNQLLIATRAVVPDRGDASWADVCCVYGFREAEAVAFAGQWSARWSAGLGVSDEVAIAERVVASLRHNRDLRPLARFPRVLEAIAQAHERLSTQGLSAARALRIVFEELLQLSGETITLAELCRLVGPAALATREDPRAGTADISGLADVQAAFLSDIGVIDAVGTQWVVKPGVLTDFVAAMYAAERQLSRPLRRPEVAGDVEFDLLTMTLAAEGGVAIDDAILEVLSESNDAMDAHKRLLFAGAAALASPTLSEDTTRIVSRAITAAGGRLHIGRYRRRAVELEQALAALLSTPSTQRATETEIIRMLGDDEMAPFLMSSLARSTYSSLGLLNAVSESCGRPRFPRLAPEIRYRLALALVERGERLPPAYSPMSTVLAELRGVDSTGAANLGEYLQSRAEWIDPALTRVLREATSIRVVDPQVLLSRLLEKLAVASGDDFDSLARLAVTFDEEATESAVHARLARLAGEPISAARFVAITASERLPPDLPERVVRALLPEDLPVDPVMAPWVWRARPVANRDDVAWQRLSQIIVSEGAIDASTEALDLTVRLAQESPRIGMHLASALQLDDRAEVAPESAGRDESAVVRQVTALLCASRATAPLTRSQLQQIVESLPSDGNEHRRRALDTLAIRRSADLVSDDVLVAASELEEGLRRASDMPAAEVLAGLSDCLDHSSDGRIIDWIEQRAPWGAGRVDPRQITDRLIGRVDDWTDEQVSRLIRGCWAAQEEDSTSTDGIARFECLVWKCAGRSAFPEAAALFGGVAGRCGDLTGLVEFVREAHQSDPVAAGVAATAAMVAFDGELSAETAASLEAILRYDHVCDEEPKEVYTALLLLCGRSAARNPSTLTRALLRARHRSGPAAKSVQQAVSCRIFKELRSAVELREILAECSAALAASRADSPECDANVPLALSILREAERLRLTGDRALPQSTRRVLTEVARAAREWTTRTAALELAISCDGLDGNALGALISSAALERASVAATINWRSARVPTCAVPELLALVRNGRDPYQVHVASVHLAQLFGTGRRSADIQHLLPDVRKVLAARAEADDPILDFSRGRGLLSVRETLWAITDDIDDEFSVPRGNHDYSSTWTDPWPGLARFTPGEALPRAFDLEPAEISADDSLPEAARKWALIRSPGAGTVELANGGFPLEAATFVNELGYRLLEARIGARIEGTLTDELRDEFRFLIESGDESEAIRLLQAARPDHKHVVREVMLELQQEFELVRDDLAAYVESILGETPSGRTIID